MGYTSQRAQDALAKHGSRDTDPPVKKEEAKTEVKKGLKSTVSKAKTSEVRAKQNVKGGAVAVRDRTARTHKQQAINRGTAKLTYYEEQKKKNKVAVSGNKPKGSVSGNR